jgi:hypothetical protein
MVGCPIEAGAGLSSGSDTSEMSVYFAPFSTLVIIGYIASWIADVPRRIGLGLFGSIVGLGCVFVVVPVLAEFGAVG